ncbi:energy transducer TonB [Christiangramia sediminis]|uniref:Energy transducer TonB n=1 Tax=Christiangramia sediminis TaxID=2881336 RepID=A0A9X1LLI3_9FLAO|nr:energy transducer TonB [Christiangramia sediminis]MCB7482499.1 energy transducer TonB [Christiangramia sediminis]
MKKLVFIACFLIGGVTFSNAQQTSPVWPGCENSEDIKECFNQKLSQHVRENYEYPQNDAGEYVRGKVTISFAIDENGEVVVNSIEGEEPQVKKAAKEMIMKIPDMEPGTLNGEADSRNFTVPFNF